MVFLAARLVPLTPTAVRVLQTEAGMRFKRVVIEAVPVTHPREDEMSFLYGTIFCAPPLEPGVRMRQFRGEAHIAGRCEWFLDPENPLSEGFLVR